MAHWDGNSRAAAGRRVLAKRLMDYATSPVCKTPLDEAISHTERARKNLLREMKQHVSDRKDRDELYQTIRYDVSHVPKNTGRVLGGDEPLKLEKPKLEPLALPYKRTSYPHTYLRAEEAAAPGCAPKTQTHA